MTAKRGRELGFLKLVSKLDHKVISRTKPMQNKLTRMCKLGFVYVLLFLPQKELCNISCNPIYSTLRIVKIAA